jgi:hypothetical protein
MPVSERRTNTHLTLVSSPVSHDDLVAARRNRFLIRKGECHIQFLAEPQHTENVYVAGGPGEETERVVCWPGYTITYMSC